MNLFGFGNKKQAAAAPSRAGASGGGGGGGGGTSHEKTLEAIKTLRDQLEILEKRRNVLQQRADVCHEEAKEHARKGEKQQALIALKRKKMKEQEVAKLGNMMITLESQSDALENAAVTVSTMKALEKGVTTIKAINSTMDPDRVDDMMEEMQEQQANQQQISDIFENSASALYDDEELQEELRQLEEEDAAQQLLQHDMPSPSQTATTTSSAAAASTATTRPAVVLPSAPSGRIATTADALVDAQVDEELRQLQLSMGV